MSNRLADSSSAYLRQHAENPVDWWPWGIEAMAEATRLDRPIFLSVGYAACHWCHVMAHESFEDLTIAETLNQNFISIKVDREERPDVDTLYMAATQLVAGHGGWPMSVFLLPNGRPFMAGTYYPPNDRSGQTGFRSLLLAMSSAWKSQRGAVEEQADELQRGLEREVSFVDHLAPFVDRLDLSDWRRRLRDELCERLDKDGGFGGAPKFPRPSYAEALMEFDDAISRDALTRTLDAMSRRGLYDHIGGGFARYSVDAKWYVPHFEKMLCDQALLARCYLRAAKVAGRNEWREVALDTLRFVLEEMAVEEGFASSLDADANGVEGSHITWTAAEVAEALGASGGDGHLDAVMSRWSIGEEGELDGRSIPRLATGEPFTCPAPLQSAQDALRQYRKGRVQPGRDEKVILEWNAMLASALIQSDEPDLVGRGLDLLHSLGESHFDGLHWWRTQRRTAHATAADMTWLLDTLVDAFEVSGDDEWIIAAREVAQYLLLHYWDGDVPSTTSPDVGGGLFSTSDLVNDLGARPKEIFDGATPSDHAIGCRSLARLALCTGDEDIMVVAQRLAMLAATLLARHPGAVPDLLDAAGYAFDGVEVVVPGERCALSEHVRLMSVPRSVLVTGSGTSPLLRDRRAGLGYVCRGGICQLPVASVDELTAQLIGAAR